MREREKKKENKEKHKICNWNPINRRENVDRNIWGNTGWEFSKTSEIHQSIEYRSFWIPTSIYTNKITPRHRCLWTPKTNKIFKGKKDTLLLKEKQCLSLTSHKLWKPGNNDIKLLKCWKNFQIRILFLMKYMSKNKGRISTFRKKLREFVTSKLSLKNKSEGKWPYMEVTDKRINKKQQKK